METNWTPKVRDEVCVVMTYQGSVSPNSAVVSTVDGQDITVPAADLLPAPDPAAPTVEEVLDAGVERCVTLLDDASETDCPAVRWDDELALESGCPCDSCKPPEASWRVCWERVMRKKILHRARQLRAEREVPRGEVL